jgi:hypothetical protein
MYLQRHQAPPEALKYEAARKALCAADEAIPAFSHRIIRDGLQNDRKAATEGNQLKRARSDAERALRPLEAARREELSKWHKEARAAISECRSETCSDLLEGLYAAQDTLEPLLVAADYAARIAHAHPDARLHELVQQLRVLIDLAERCR